VSGWPYPRLIAHRGGGTLAPENTLAAFAVAARYGCRAVEFDVRLSAEGTPFLLHDATLDRTTSGKGPIAETADAVLRTLDAGGWHGAGFAGEPLPTLHDAIDRCSELGLWANIELKAARGAETACAEGAIAVVRAAWQGPPPLLSSFSTAVLAAARELAPELPRALVLARFAPRWRAQAEHLGCVAVHSAADSTTPAHIAAVRQAGFGLACYTVNDPEEARRWFAAGVDALFTDRPDRVRLD